jgi:hypothetical protein
MPHAKPQRARTPNLPIFAPFLSHKGVDFSPVSWIWLEKFSDEARTHYYGRRRDTNFTNLHEWETEIRTLRHDPPSPGYGGQGKTQ